MSDRPPLTVLLGPAGSGKTASCLNRVLGRPAETRLVVPSAAHATFLMETLRNRGADAEAEHVRPFAKLLTELAGMDGKENRAVTSAFRRAALTDIFERHLDKRPDSYFSRMKGSPGFITALGESIRELKLTGIRPADLGGAGPTAGESLDDPQFTTKVAELAELFAAYERLLAANRLHDDEDSATLAASRVRSGSALVDFKTLLVDGFFRLSPAWRDVLAAIAESEIEVVVTLTYDSGRPLLFATPERSLDSLRQEFSVNERHLTPPPESHRPSALAHLERHLFSPSPPLPISPSPILPLTINDAPNPYAEVEMAVRALRREHDVRGTPWAECALILRSPSDYLSIITSVCERFEVPVTVQQPIQLIDTPPVKALAYLCDIFGRGWQREDVISWLKSSYSGGDKIAAGQVLESARRKGVREGRGSWERLVAGGGPRSLHSLFEWDDRLFTRQLPAEALANAVSDMASDLGMTNRCRKYGRDDDSALQQALGIAHEIGRFARIHKAGAQPLDEFVRILRGAWSAAPFVRAETPDSVAVLEPYDARQRDFRFVAVLGLTEKVFPRRANEDPFLRDSEREALAAAGLPHLENGAERAEDERLLFYLSCTAPTEWLDLSYPRAGDESDMLPSFYIDEVRVLFDHIPTDLRTLADVGPSPDECVNDRDRILSGCLEIQDAAANSTASGLLWHERIHAGAVPFTAGQGSASSQSIESLIESVSLPALPRLSRAEIRVRYAGTHRLDVTEIETYRRCPFQHFMRYAMGLQARRDGGGPADRGRMYHSVVRKAMRRGASGEKPEDELLAPLLTDEMESLLANAALDARPHRRAMLERFLSDALAGFAAREGVFAERFGMSPKWFELAFGMEPKPDEGQDSTESREYDPASTARPLVIDPEDGSAPIHLCGAIDRVDLSPDGAVALLMDYKTGGTVAFEQMKSGDSLQMPLYLMALEQLWNVTVGAACYDSPRETGRRRFFRTRVVDPKQFAPIPAIDAGKDMVSPVNPEQLESALKAARLAVSAAVRGIQSADILPRPGNHCRYCDFAGCCRTTLDNVHDGEPFDIMSEAAAA